VVMTDPVAHHSTLLPFRELAKRFPIKKGGCAIFPTRSSHRILQDPPALKPQEPWELLEVETLELHADMRGGCGRCDLADLAQALDKVTRFGETSATNDSVLAVVVLAGTSNVSGCSLDMYGVNELVHQHAGLVCWDVAATAAHRKLDFSPVHRPQAASDFAFVSPHKLLGGPGSAGLLLAKKRLLCNAVPVVPGGGVVFYVSSKGHSYIQNAVEREEAGTPNIAACIRTGLVYHVHSWLAQNKLEILEQRAANHLLAHMRSHPKIQLLLPQAGGACQHAGGCGDLHVGSIISFKVLYGNVSPDGQGLYLHHNFVAAVWRGARTRRCTLASLLNLTSPPLRLVALWLQEHRYEAPGARAGTSPTGGRAPHVGSNLTSPAAPSRDAQVLNDLFGVQGRGGCACSGPYAQALLGIDPALSGRFDACLHRSALDILRPGFVRIGIHFSMARLVGTFVWVPRLARACATPSLLLHRMASLMPRARLRPHGSPALCLPACLPACLRTCWLASK